MQIYLFSHPNYAKLLTGLDADLSGRVSPGWGVRDVDGDGAAELRFEWCRCIAGDGVEEDDLGEEEQGALEVVERVALVGSSIGA